MSYQFKALCFGLSTAPQVFTRVMAPVSAMLHCRGIRMLRYLNDWLVLASSRADALWARDGVLFLCRDPGIAINLPKNSPSSIPVCHLPGDVLSLSDFEGFPLSGECFLPPDTERRVSILQTAKRRLLAQPARPPVVPLSVSPRRSSPHAVSPTWFSAPCGTLSTSR